MDNAKDRMRKADDRAEASLQDLNETYGTVLLLASVDVREAADSL